MRKAKERAKASDFSINSPPFKRERAGPPYPARERVQAGKCLNVEKARRCTTVQEWRAKEGSSEGRECRKQGARGACGVPGQGNDALRGRVAPYRAFVNAVPLGKCASYGAQARLEPSR